MSSPRDQAIADITAIIDRLLAPPPVVTPPPVVAIPPVTPPATGHPRIILGSQAPRLRAALNNGSAAALAWKATCVRWLAGGDVYNFAAWNGALLFALTGDARYGAEAIAQIDAQVTSAEAQIAAGRAPEVAGDSYLQVGEMIGDLALVYDWCNAMLTPAQRTRWIAYANQAVSNVWHCAAASWGGKVMPWTGWSLDNPNNNYYYSFLRATMLLGLATQGESSSSATWLAMARDTKIIGQLVPTFERDLQGGCSREGTGYGVAMRNLWELYATWQWSTGENLSDKTSHTRQSMTTFMHQVVPTMDHVALTGDLSRDSTGAFFDYHRDYLQKLIALYPTDPVAASAFGMIAASSVPKMSNGFMQGYDFIYAPVGGPANGVQLPTMRYAPGIGQIYARTDWSKQATWMNLIAGPYTESHAHQDQGSITIFKGTWLASDSVFWSHSGVIQPGTVVGSTKGHSLVRVDQGGQPIGQVLGSTSKVITLRAASGFVFASLDLSPAYAGTAVTVMRRQVLWLQPDVFIIQDHVVSKAGTTQIWQLVVPDGPAIGAASAGVSFGGHAIAATRQLPSVGAWTARDLRNSPDKDFSGGWVLEQAQPGGDQTFLTVVSVDGARAPSMDDVTFTDGGVTFMLGGKRITVGPGIDAT